MSYISVQGLCKHFDVRQKREKGSLLRKKERVQALQDVSFDVEQGELVGYIGPNGAGKSTTVKILSGIMVPDSGSQITDAYRIVILRLKKLCGRTHLFVTRAALSEPAQQKAERTDTDLRIPSTGFRTANTGSGWMS